MEQILNLQNKQIQESVKQSIKELFPIKSKSGRTLELNNLIIEDTLNDYDFPAQKEIKLNHKSWQVPIYGELVLSDSKTGRIIDKTKKIKIGNIPKMTNRFSALIDGNEYQIAHQIRRKSGVYSHIKKNGELESEFNLSKGANFSIILDPQDSKFYMELSDSTRRYRLWTILSTLGISELDMKKSWGSELYEINKRGALNTEVSEITSMYTKIFKKEESNYIKLSSEFKNYFNTTEMDKTITNITLGKEYSSANGEAILAASKKILDISRGEKEPDERDSLLFKKILATDDLTHEFFKKQLPSLQRKLERSVENKDRIKDFISSSLFTEPIKKFFTTSEVSNPVVQTNPVTIAAEGLKTTLMGEGAIGDINAVTMDTRDVHPTQIGFLDPTYTPESKKAGITVGLASEAKKIGAEMKTPVYDKNLKIHYFSPTEMFNEKIGFPDQYNYIESEKILKPKGEIINVLYQGQTTVAHSNDVKYFIRSPRTMFSYQANLIPFLQNVQANRTSMGSRMITQALPLDQPEVPLVQTYRDNKSTYEDVLGSYLNPKALEDGAITKIDKNYIYVNQGNKIEKYGLYNNFILNQDGYLNSTTKFKVGDKVKKGDILATNNYNNDDGTLAMGKNLLTAYMSYKGYNFEDGVVMTESAAKKMTHSMIHRISIAFSPKQTIFDLKKFTSWYPEEINPTNFNKLDSEGLIKIGETVNKDDIVAAFLVKNEMDDIQQILKRLDKYTFGAYLKNITKWDQEDLGIVQEVRTVGNTIDIYIKSVHPLREGDKISGRYGNKGIITKIIPDSDAPHLKNGATIELLLSPEGVPGRMNVGQIMETAAGRIAEKNQKPYIVKNFDQKIQDWAQKVADDLKENKLEINQDVYDGRTGKKINTPIFVGKQYIMKLRHVVDKKEGIHTYGTYDIEEQPAGKGVQMIGALDTYAYLAHGAKANMYEQTAIKGRKNEEYWRAVQLGITPPAPARNFIFDKMVTYMKGAGINVEKKGNKLQIFPMTDKDTIKLSNGEITDAGAMLVGKNLASRKGGTFDTAITGGMHGTKWSHIELAERFPNPTFENPIMKLLGLTEKKYSAILEGKEKIGEITGKDAIIKELESINVDSDIEKYKKELITTSESNVNNLNSKIKYLSALKELHLSPIEAYTISKFPVIPPIFRPIYPMMNGTLVISEVNRHYKDLGVMNTKYKQVSDLLIDSEKIKKQKELYDIIKATRGLTDPTTYSGRKYKGFLKQLSEMKVGIIQGPSWQKPQDLSARSTAVVDPSLGLDQLGLPKEMAYKIMKPFIIQDMKLSGFSAFDSLNNYNKQEPIAWNSLQNVLKQRPVLLNRAPTLHKHSVLAFNGQLVDGKAIRTNPLIIKGFNLDYDGDEQINSVVIYIDKVFLSNIDFSLDIYKKFSYIQSIDNFELLTKTQNFMSSRFNVKLPVKSDGMYLITNLEDFPYDKNNLLGTKDHIDFYGVPEGVQVVAYDEAKDELVLANVSGWSIHKDREIWTITLGNDRQIISDDDPRAVYGIKPDTLDFVRSAPTGALRMLVPIAKSTEEVKNKGWELTEIAGIKDSKIKDRIKLNKEVGYVIGALIGDGWVDSQNDKNNRINLAGIEKPVVAQYENFLIHIFNEKPHVGHRVSLDSYGQSEKHTVSSVDFANWIAPFIGKGAINKHLPTFWFNTTYDFKIGLISGLMDTDGCISVSHSKDTPQLLVSFDSISIRLVQEVQHLLLSLGVRSKIGFSKKTSVGNDFWHLTISTVDFQKIKGDLIIAHEKNIESLKCPVNSDSGPAVRTDLVPITNEIISILTKKVTNRIYSSLYSSLMQAKKKYYVSRKAAIESIAIHGEEGLPKKWLKIVQNFSVTWSPVVSVENTCKKETGYDLTVPGYETFMSIDGVILSNTMSVMVPVGKSAVEEARNMIPSKLLFKQGDNTVMPEITKDYQFGLYNLSLITGNTGRIFDNIDDAKEANIKWTDTFTLNGKLITIGQYYLNKELPEELKDYTRILDSKTVEKITNILAIKYPNDFGNIIDTWKTLGADFSYSFGHTLSLNDFLIDRSYRDKLLKTELPKIEKIPAQNRLEAYLNLTKKITEAQNETMSNKNNLKLMLDSGSFNKSNSIQQMISMPGILEDIHGIPLSTPITKSYGEGLDTKSYWQTYSGARKGTYDRSVGTADTGALNKSLLAVSRRFLVIIEDCNTAQGLDFELDDKNVMDRCLTESISGVGSRNDIVTGDIVLKAKQKNLNTLNVRSPLTCEAVNGVCKKCYGLLPNGQFANIGDNVGIIDSQAVTERATQLIMKTFHSGGAVGNKQKAVSGFTRLEQLIKVPEYISNKAALSSIEGTVKSITKNAIGGYNININGKDHTIIPGLLPKVSVGDFVNKGTPLSDGVIKPQELGALTNHLNAQKYIVKEMSDTYGPKFYKKTFETIIKSISDNAVVTAAPVDSGYIRGDKSTISTLNYLNKQRLGQQLDPIQFIPYFKSTDVQNADIDDWLTQATTNRIKNALITGAAKGSYSNIKGKDPIPAYIYADEFGKNLNPQKGEFY